MLGQNCISDDVSEKLISLTPKEVPCIRHLKIAFLSTAVHWWLIDHSVINRYISFFLLLFIFAG